MFEQGDTEKFSNAPVEPLKKKKLIEPNQTIDEENPDNFTSVKIEIDENKIVQPYQPPSQ
jgi:hypothetical protein